MKSSLSESTEVLPFLKSFKAALKGFLNDILEELPAKFFTKSSMETSKVTLIPPCKSSPNPNS